MHTISVTNMTRHKNQVTPIVSTTKENNIAGPTDKSVYKLICIQIIPDNDLVLLITIYNCFLSLARLLNGPQIVHSATL